jgi:hypothetical protein
MNSDSRRRQLRMSYIVRYIDTTHSFAPRRYPHLWHSHPQ